jgi:O-antigen ligase/tetratricopeptide (TPR) repeat protein
LAAAVIVPLFFNVYTSRVFEPDKISQLRSLVMIMTVAWLVKLLEGGWRAMRSDNSEGRSGLSSAVEGAAKAGLPPWLGFLRVPMIIPILVYALAYLVSSIFTITPDPTWFGSYQRLQGTYTQYSYMMLGILVLANLRTRPQLERLISFMILTAIPVTFYGFLQWARLDPLPWAGDTSTRVASTMGNAIFVAAWLIMIVPLVLYRLFTSMTSAPSAEQAEPVAETGRRGRSQTVRTIIENPYGWAVISTIFGVLLTQALFFFLALKLMAGLPFPDASMWWVLPLSILVFYLGCLAIEWLGKKGDDPGLGMLIVPITGVTIFVISFVAIPFSWELDRGEDGGIKVITNFDGSVLPWVFFFVFLWAAVSAGTRLLTILIPGDEEREAPVAGLFMVYAAAIIGQGLFLFFTGASILWALFYILLWGVISSGIYALLGSGIISASQNPGKAVLRWGLNAGYGLLLFLQVLCIYLTQSRGPWLGLGLALVTFAVSIWLVGRRRGVRWMARLGGAVSAIVLVLALFVVALNIPDSPLKALSNLPGVGRGIERLSTLTRTEDGTGKVRELIWEGATNLILSDPVRAIIGWGPEAMYVAYSRFYPPELAHWELRNATPDRSHNVEFDQLVTMGLVGLMTYYFLVGAFFYYGIRTLKRATNTRDQLLVIALLSAMAAHFMEIQTGIQIAATWSYFYLLIGILVAFGFYINGYLRQDYVVPVTADIHSDDSLSGDIRGNEVAPPRSRQTIPASKESGGRRSREGERARTTPEPSARQRLRASRPLQSQQAQPERPLASHPALMALYAVLFAGALIFAWLVNVSTVQADTHYKQGLAYDNQQMWHESIHYYSRAIATQPNQDYYYLFLGRSWLEFAKQVDQERRGSTFVQRTKQGIPDWPDDGNARVLYRVSTDVPCTDVPRTYRSEEDRQAEALCRLRQSQTVLERARNLNPLNTDHYANLGRLYLYWADASGMGDASKAPLAVQNLETATKRTPGNAQLWDELAVAYARNNQFSKAMETLAYSQTQVDPRFARTPFLRGQLYQERALNVKDLLTAGRALPTDGETDYGKLMLEAGKAYSETIALDPGQFLDPNHTIRIAFLLDAAEPFTNTNTTLPPDVVSNVLTSTVKLALDIESAKWEKQLADYLRSRGAYDAQEEQVPDNLLESMWQSPVWARFQRDGKSREWADSTLAAQAKNASLLHTGLGYIYSQTGAPDQAQEHYQRALLLDPNNQQAQKALQPASPQP